MLHHLNEYHWRFDESNWRHQLKSKGAIFECDSVQSRRATAIRRRQRMSNTHDTYGSDR